MARLIELMSIRTTIEYGYHDQERVLIATTPDCPAPGFIYSHRVVVHRKLTSTIRSRDLNQAIAKHAELIKANEIYYNQKRKPDENSTPRS